MDIYARRKFELIFTGINKRFSPVRRAKVQGKGFLTRSSNHLILFELTYELLFIYIQLLESFICSFNYIL